MNNTFLLRVRNKLRHLLRPNALLDYSSPITMAINSSFDIMRLRGCEKEPETVAWLEASLDENSVFYDIGANVGAYSLIASLRGAQVYAVEPSPATFATLSENILLNNASDTITAFQCLVGDDDSLETLHFSSSQSGAAEHSYETGTLSQTIPMFRIETLIERLGLSRPTHVKIDVDGAEMSVLRGVNLSSVQSLLVETENDDVRMHLESQGFALSKKFPRKKQGAFNSIFTRANA